MPLTSADLVGMSLARLQAAQPSHSGGIARWFQKNDRYLSPLASAIAKQAQRGYSRLQGVDAPSQIVNQLLGLLHQRLPDQHLWAQTNAELLKLMVRASIAALEGSGSAVKLLAQQAWNPPIPPTLASERTLVNIRAINIASAGRPITAEERNLLQRYSGNGGLSLERIASQVPPEWVPDSKASVDEYYTPPAVCAAIAGVIAALLGPDYLTGAALEPAAGIGRFVGACSARPELAGLRWTAVEYSRVSAAICRLLYPLADVHNLPFEQWIADNYDTNAGQLALVVTNPPYGVRGGNKTLDPDKSYRDDIAYLYFIRRPFDMLRPGGVGVALVPRGFLSGTGAPAVKARASVLRRHHLLCAYRLPSGIYPGASIVTDVSFWRARGGELTSTLPEDQAVVEGGYFSEFPGHVLGVEEVSKRGRHSVAGSFTTLPPLATRPECQSCSLTPFLRPLVRVAPREETLSEEMQAAHHLGKRVDQFLTLAASPVAQEIERAASLHSELYAAVGAWLEDKRQRLGSYEPSKDTELLREAKGLPSLAALLSVVSDGKPTAAFTRPPVYVPAYVGPSTVAAHAEWLWAKTRRLTLKGLHQFRRDLGVVETLADVEMELVAQSWCEDWPEDGPFWLPASDYYSGELWPKLDRARGQGTVRAHVQLARLLELVGVVTLEEAAPTPRDAWVPPESIQIFLAHYLAIEIPPLHWFRALMKPVGIEYSEIAKVDERLQTALGYINHDLAWFHPAYTKETDPTTGEEESAEQAKDRARLAYGAAMSSAFRNWLQQAIDHQERILDGYRRTFRGYVTPVYPPDPLPIARWGARITLKPHQAAGAWRLIRNNGGLLAFDVGVGKTLTGTAALAYLREIGRARRPLIIVPNSIIWKWYREIQRALPDYRVVVVGAVRYQGRDGVFRSRLDDAGERAKKWSEFKIGLYDAAICSYSVFPRTTVSEESLRQFIEETPTLLREVGLKTARMEQEIEKINELYEKRNETEKRLRALIEESEGRTADSSDLDSGAEDGEEDGED